MARLREVERLASMLRCVDRIDRPGVILTVGSETLALTSADPVQRGLLRTLIRNELHTASAEAGQS